MTILLRRMVVIAIEIMQVDYGSGVYGSGDGDYGDWCCGDV